MHRFCKCKGKKNKTRCFVLLNTIQFNHHRRSKAFDITLHLAFLSMVKIWHGLSPHVLRYLPILFGISGHAVTCGQIHRALVGLSRRRGSRSGSCTACDPNSRDTGYKKGSARWNCSKKSKDCPNSSTNTIRTPFIYQPCSPESLLDVPFPLPELTLTRSPC